MPKICVVVPTIRPEMHASFLKAWGPLFEKHKATLVTVWDGESPGICVTYPGGYGEEGYPAFEMEPYKSNRDLFCRRTDACRNLGFVVAARLGAEVVVTMDDDVAPETAREFGGTNQVMISDPIQAHLDALSKRVPISWMNTAHDTDLYLRGVPYGVRDEAPVMMSHGVWVGTPDFDGETQLRLERGRECPKCGITEIEQSYGLPVCKQCGALTKQLGVPYSLPYYVGPIPKAVLMPICGMNLAFRAEMLPFVYFAPQGPDSGVEGLNRFADIWMGVYALRAMWERGWACYTGASTVLHTRASDARKNFEQEKLGREWNEWMWNGGRFCENDPEDYKRYVLSYAEKRSRYAALITNIMEKGK